MTSEVVRVEWAHRIEAEYRSATLAHHYVLWLLQLGFSPDLVREGLEIVADELDHARLSYDVFTEAGGQGSPVLDRSSLTLDAALDGPIEDLERAITVATIQMFCLGETVAVPLFRHFRTDCTVATARNALDRVVADEGRHSAFGWRVLDELIARWGVGRVRTVMEPALVPMLATLDRSYGRGATKRAVGTNDEQDRAWGVVPSSEYEPILRSTAERVWIGRFAALDIDFATAWEHATGAEQPSAADSMH